MITENKFFQKFIFLVLWTFQGLFILELANDYVKSSNKLIDNILVKFYGTFMILYQLNQVLGNILSSVVFKFLNQNQNNASASVANISQLNCGIYDTKNKVENLAYDAKAVYKILEILL